MPRQLLELAESAPVKVGNVRFKEGDPSLGVVTLLKEGDPIPMNFESSAEPQTTRVSRKFAREVDEDSFCFSRGRAGDNSHKAPFAVAILYFERREWERQIRFERGGDICGGAPETQPASEREHK